MNPNLKPCIGFFYTPLHYRNPNNPRETDKKQIRFLYVCKQYITFLDCMKHFKEHLNKYPKMNFR